MDVASPISLMAVKGLDLDPRSFSTWSSPVGTLYNATSWSPASNTQLTGYSGNFGIPGVPLNAGLNATRVRSGNFGTNMVTPSLEAYYASPVGRLSGKAAYSIMGDDELRHVRGTPQFTASYDTPAFGGNLSLGAGYSPDSDMSPSYFAAYDRPVFGEDRLSLSADISPDDYRFMAMYELPF